MCDTTTLVPIPVHLIDYGIGRGGDFPTDSPEFGIDEQGQCCFRIDSCIVPALLAVWSAGYRTLGCCCGHGQKSGGIITLDTMHGEPTTDTQKRYAAIHLAVIDSETKGGKG